MPSVSAPDETSRRGFAGVLTAGESSFRNAKLRDSALVAYKVAADIAGKGSFFVLTLIAARRLSPWAFGVFGLGTTAGWMLAVVSDFGVQMHLAREVARRPDHAQALLRRWWRFRLAAIVGCLAALAIALTIAGISFDFAAPLMLFALVYSGMSLVELFNYFYRGLSRSDIESTLTIWQRVGTLVLGSAALLFRPDVNLLAVAMLVPVAATLAWSVALAGRFEPRRNATITDDTHDRFIRDVVPIGIGIVLSAIYFRVDVLLVQIWAGTEAVARYNAAFRLIDALRLFPAAVLAVVLPSLCRADDLVPLARVAAAVTAFAVVVAAALWVFGERVVVLAFGSQYRPAVPAFRVLALAFPLLSLNFALTHQLVGWGRQQAYATVCASALAANLLLNTWLIPTLSIEGAAWATVGTEAFVTSGCLFALRGRNTPTNTVHW